MALDRHSRRDAIPFESEEEFMATLHDSERILLKGSVELVLSSSTLSTGHQHPPCSPE